MAGPGRLRSEFRANSEQTPSSEQIPGKFRANSGQSPSKHPKPLYFLVILCSESPSLANSRERTSPWGETDHARNSELSTPSCFLRECPCLSLSLCLSPFSANGLQMYLRHRWVLNHLQAASAAIPRRSPSSDRFVSTYHSNHNVYQTNSPDYEVGNGKIDNAPKILLILKSVIPTGDLVLFSRHTGTLVGKFARLTYLKFRGN